MTPPRVDSPRATAFAIFRGHGGPQNAGAWDCFQYRWCVVLAARDAANRVRTGLLSKAWDGSSLPHVRSATGHRGGATVELLASLLLMGRALFRVPVRTPVFVAHAVPLWSKTCDLGGQRTSARARPRTPH